MFLLKAKQGLVRRLSPMPCMLLVPVPVGNSFFCRVLRLMKTVCRAGYLALPKMMNRSLP